MQELHARLEPLLVFTIDGANFLDVEDPKWEVVAAVVTRGGRPYMVRGAT
jgi:histone acetyltransferase 1